MLLVMCVAPRCAWEAATSSSGSTFPDSCGTGDEQCFPALTQPHVFPYQLAPLTQTWTHGNGGMSRTSTVAVSLLPDAGCTALPAQSESSQRRKDRFLNHSNKRTVFLPTLISRLLS